MNSALETLRQHPAFWGGRERDVVATGYDALDGVLPDGGWPVGALTEIVPVREGMGELRLLMPCLARLTRESRWVAWVSPPHRLYGPALAASGVELSRVLVVSTSVPEKRWWAAEQALRSRACGAVLVWGDDAGPTGLRRLHLAAEKGKNLGFLFRSARTASQPSPAALRLSVGAAPAGLAVRILKGQGSLGRGVVLADPVQRAALSSFPRSAAASLAQAPP